MWVQATISAGGVVAGPESCGVALDSQRAGFSCDVHSDPGHATFGVHAGLPLGEHMDVMPEASSLGDRNCRGVGLGLDGAGRGVSLRWESRFCWKTGRGRLSRRARAPAAARRR